MKFIRDIECKYCGRKMFEDNIERYKGIIETIYSVCDCGALCVQEKVQGFVKKTWHKENEI